MNGYYERKIFEMKRLIIILLLAAVAALLISCADKAPAGETESATAAETTGIPETEGVTSSETMRGDTTAEATETEPETETETETETDTETAPEVTTAEGTETGTVTGTEAVTETAAPETEQTAVTTEEGKLNIIIGTVSVKPGETAEVDISLVGVKELMSAAVVLRWDGRLSLKDAKYKTGGGMTSTPDETNANGEPDWSGVKPPFMFNWLTLNPSKALVSDTVFVTLTFGVPDNAEPGLYEIRAAADPDNLFDTNENNVDFVIINGGINVK